MKSLLPAWLRRRLAALRLTSEIYRGDYGSWAAARAASAGYEDEAILRKVVEATRAVRDGKAAWERDTVLFHELVCHEPLLRSLRAVAAAESGRLSVLDFGGALGSTWWQHRAWLGDITELRWGVVEQAAFVAAGRREFSVGPLRFHETIEACLAEERANVVLLSSVLPYLERPRELLEKLSRTGPRFLIVDRTGFTTDGRDRLTVQHVPPSIYRASYPCWFFDREKLLAPFAEDWRFVAEWPTFDGRGPWFEYRGFMLERTAPSPKGASLDQ